MVTRSKRISKKNIPWAGWSKQAPKGKQRTRMYKKCGKKCFLGPAKKPSPSFPICKKNTCKVSTKGLYAAYVRSRQWGKKRTSYKGRSKPSMKRNTYKRVARTAKRMLIKRKAFRGKTRKH